MQKIAGHLCFIDTKRLLCHNVGTQGKRLQEQSMARNSSVGPVVNILSHPLIFD